ncbi:hypothetical protein FIBSPDRAFT_747884 [Athelia psychrophila]|uniref:CNH domain-containing protein n=1 Tax=Athelia psychrophila TaxID=1759441 RepID=A0A166FKV6_9AGAM|nr:hypothetical protein FIBSPDRAFT_747884 [Fibularhizoctonia sp. CBS 109695]
MTSAPTNPYEVPPYQVQPLISSVLERGAPTAGASPQVTCAQAIGSEIYVGCSNGELLRFALQVDDPDKLESYCLLSRQVVPGGKPIDEIVLVPCASKALVLCDRQIHFYTTPSLDPIPAIKPVRNVIAFAVDHQHLSRPVPSASDPPANIAPVEFCVIKRSNVALYMLHCRADKLIYQKDMPLPQGATLARRSGHSLCIADKTNYCMIDLEKASLIELFPLSQVPDSSVVVKPCITIINDWEFLINSWTGENTIGIFVNGNGDPVRGTMEWPAHPISVCLDYPYLTTLLPNSTVEIHLLEDQSIKQVVSAPPTSRPTSPPIDGQPRPILGGRIGLANSLSGFMVPSSERSDKMRKTSVPLQRGAPVAAAV